MSRLAQLRGSRLVVATHNRGKLREFARLLAPLAAEWVSAGELGLPEPDEPGESFAENAILKARSAAALSGLPALADDSGLAAMGLDGAPGVHSARWGGPERDAAAACRRLYEALAARFGSFAAADRRAAFICVLALAFPDGDVYTFEGRVDGEIVWPPRGGGGFGYDPIFVPKGESRSFAEMSAEEKQALSHRGRAVAALLAALGDPSA